MATAWIESCVVPVKEARLSPRNTVIVSSIPGGRAARACTVQAKHRVAGAKKRRTAPFGQFDRRHFVEPFAGCPESHVQPNAAEKTPEDLPLKAPFRLMSLWLRGSVDIATDIAQQQDPKINELIVVEEIAGWEKLKALVLDSVSSPITKRVYNTALNDFWPGSSRRRAPGLHQGYRERQAGIPGRPQTRVVVDSRNVRSLFMTLLMSATQPPASSRCKE